MSELKRTTILADPDLLARVERHARLRGQTKTAVITAALRAFLEGDEAVPAELPFVGIASSGHGRLSLDGKRIAASVAGRR